MVVDLFTEIGPGPDGGILTWGEIRAWMDVTGYEVSPFVATMLRMMSGAATAMRQEATKENCPNPLLPEAERQARQKEPEAPPASDPVMKHRRIARARR